MSIRLAVIGAGIMGSDHARIFAEELPGSTLQVICDASEQRARSLAERVGAAHVLTDPEAAIARHDVDAVVIASPDFTHAPLSLASLRAGKPSLCEKPLSQSSKECLQVMDGEMAVGRRLVQVGFMRRFDQSYTEMKAALAGGRIGRALMMHNFHRNVDNPQADFTAAMAITNSAPHEFDVARFVLGVEYSFISAFQPLRSDSKVAPVFMVLETSEGQLVNIEINNNASYGYDVRGELVGERGATSVSPLSFATVDSGLEHVTRYETDWRGRYAEAYRRQNRAFLKFVQTGQFPAIAANAWDGYCAAIAAEAGVLALAQNRRVAIEMARQPAFYNSGDHN
jgi:myo-inositol 2-dehydrogenase/D-chiro-inositol 1-dehydrogenase